MRTQKLIFLAILALLATGLYQIDRGESESIYESLDTLAEVLTVAQEHAPSQIGADTLVEGAIDGLLEQLDPHSSYYNRDRYKTMREDQKGAFYGIGVIVGYQNNQLTVITPMEGTPAWDAGLRPGDVIESIDGTVTKDADFYEAIRLLRGDKGTKVAVTILRTGLDQPIPLVLERAEIPTNNVRTSFMLNDEIGYVSLKDFGESASEEVEKAASALEKQGMRQLILDLRGNPGGLLPQAIKVSSLFIPGKKLVVYTEGRLQSASQKYYSEKSSSLEQIPLIVLIDRGSASASEIVAGAIQDHDRGLIVGTNSWGKGLVQSVFPLSKGTRGLALTTSRYYTPSGRNIQGDYESLESYYNPESSETQYFEETADKKLVKTLHGRPIAETRGITPDVFMTYRVDPKTIQELETKHSAFFNFAAAYKHKAGVVARDWVADQTVFDAFRDYLQEKELDQGDVTPYKDTIIRKITYQMLYIHDADWAWQYRMRHDVHVNAAQELFDKAQALLQVFNGLGKLPSGYSNELRQFAELKKRDREEQASGLSRQ